jgi:hypothetical protein
MVLVIGVLIGHLQMQAAIVLTGSAATISRGVHLCRKA